MILSASMKHGGTYYYKVHKLKAEGLCSNGFEPLKSFLYVVLKDRPDEYFLEGPRSSVLRMDVKAPMSRQEHEVKLLARMGLESNYYDNAHMNVEMFMLAYDNKTLAVEVPLWLLPEEFEDFSEMFGSNLPLSGHIDILRVEDGFIWIWDYKPNAHREKYAATQIYFYARMLSARTGIPLDKFMCGYFDDKNSYVFSPGEVVI